MCDEPPTRRLVAFREGARQRLRKLCCGASFPLPIDGSVAQLDRALASGARGRAFESRRAHSGSSAPASTSVGAGFSFGAPWIWDHPRVELRYATHLLKTPVPVPSGLGSGVIFGSPHDPEQKWRENELKRWRSWRPSSMQAEPVNQRRHRMRRSLGQSRKRRGTCTERWWLPTRFQSAEPDFDRSSRGADRHLAHHGPSHFGRGAPQPSPRGARLVYPSGPGLKSRAFAGHARPVPIPVTNLASVRRPLAGPCSVGALPSRALSWVCARIMLLRLSTAIRGVQGHGKPLVPQTRSASTRMSLRGR